VLVVWIFLVTRFVNQNFSKPKVNISEEFSPPRADLAFMVIAALTIYMAIRSRRFIPIAAIAACPVIAMFIDQIVSAVSTAYNFHKQNQLAVSPMPHKVRWFFIIAAAIANLTFGLFWGIKFKQVYLDPWPIHSELTSVFMRMTASWTKPFYVCRFIRENKLEGKMFNYWTEGGFIAWSQEPDPNTGKTPLQLFMDGRAQAAYEPDVYIIWTDIVAGGPIALTAYKQKRALTKEDYIKVGHWLDSQLKSRDVWVALVPVEKSADPFVKGLEVNSNWTTVYHDDWQRLFVDMTDSRGKELFTGIMNGKTLYSEAAVGGLVKSRFIRLYDQGKDTKQKGLELAIKSFNSSPSQAAIIEIISYEEFPELKSGVAEFCAAYADDFDKNRDSYMRKDGYLRRLWVTLKMVEYLMRHARENNDNKLAYAYAVKYKEYLDEQQSAKRNLTW
jgi:hypothetical protein